MARESRLFPDDRSRARYNRVLLPVLPLLLSLLLAACGGGGGGGDGGGGSGPPAAPTNASAEPVNGQMVVSWTHDGARVSQFTISREAAASASGPMSAAAEEVATVGSGVREFIDRTATVGTEYVYTVVAAGSGGSSGAAAAGPATVEQGIALSVGIRRAESEDLTIVLCAVETTISLRVNEAYQRATTPCTSQRRSRWRTRYALPLTKRS